MSQRLGLALSLLAACGIHAILLFAPRAARGDGADIPVIEVELGDAGVPQSPATRPGPGTAPRTPLPPPAAAPAAPEAQTPTPTPAARAPVSAPESAQVPAPGPELDGQADSADVPGPATTETATAPGPVTEGGTGPVVPGNGGSPSSTGSAPGSAPGGGASAAVPAYVPTRPLVEVRPKYPLSARRSGFEGSTEVKVYVNDKGEVTGVELVSSSGHSSLDHAVLDTYRAFRYTPALRDGKPVAGTFERTVRFKLTDP